MKEDLELEKDLLNRAFKVQKQLTVATNIAFVFFAVGLGVHYLAEAPILRYLSTILMIIPVFILVHVFLQVSYYDYLLNRIEGIRRIKDFQHVIEEVKNGQKI